MECSFNYQRRTKVHNLDVEKKFNPDFLIPFFRGPKNIFLRTQVGFLTIFFPGPNVDFKIFFFQGPMNMFLRTPFGFFGLTYPKISGNDG